MVDHFSMGTRADPAKPNEPYWLCACGARFDELAELHAHIANPEGVEPSPPAAPPPAPGPPPPMPERRRPLNEEARALVEAAWAARQDFLDAERKWLAAVHAQRDAVQAAVRAGVTKVRLAERLGVSRGAVQKMTRDVGVDEIGEEQR